MNSNPAESLKVVCSECNHTKVLHSGDLEKILGSGVKVTTVNQFYGKLTCSACSSKAIRVSDANDRLLIDPEHYSECRRCGLPIEYPRIQALPETNVCADCASDTTEKSPKTHQPEPIKFDSELIPEHLKKCPSCGKATILRMNRRTKERFVGCSSFPRCRLTSKVVQ